MIEKSITIINKLGLHARAATQLVKLAGEFDAEISIEANGLSADAKSIMDVLMLAATQGTETIIRIDGEDEEADDAMHQIETLINNRFNEQE